MFHQKFVNQIVLNFSQQIDQRNVGGIHRIRGCGTGHECEDHQRSTQNNSERKFRISSQEKFRISVWFFKILLQNLPQMILHSSFKNFVNKVEARYTRQTKAGKDQPVAPKEEGMEPEEPAEPEYRWPYYVRASMYVVGCPNLTSKNAKGRK